MVVRGVAEHRAQELLGRGLGALGGGARVELRHEVARAERAVVVRRQRRLAQDRAAHQLRAAARELEADHRPEARADERHGAVSDELRQVGGVLLDGGGVGAPVDRDQLERLSELRVGELDRPGRVIRGAAVDEDDARSASGGDGVQRRRHRG